MRPSKVEMLMEIAHAAAKRSTCSRLKVGAVLADQYGESVWLGYNGSPRGAKNGCRHEGVPGGCGCSHAEANALIRADARVEKIAVFTDSPCVPCAGLLVNANVTEFYYDREYRNTEGLDVLREAGVYVEQVPTGFTHSHTDTVFPYPHTEAQVTAKYTADRIERDKARSRWRCT